jgi:hypothetical protein
MEEGAAVIAVFVLSLAVCFGAPLALVQRRPVTPAADRAPLEENEVSMVSALLVGDISRRAYRDGMARVARQAAELEPADPLVPASTLGGPVPASQRSRGRRGPLRWRARPRPR